MKKRIILMSSLFTLASASADTTPMPQDDILSESAEALKCASVEVPAKITTVSSTMTPMKPVLPEKTAAPESDNLGESKAIEVPLDEITEGRTLSPAEKLKAYRSKLEEKNLVLLEKKLELIRLEQEMALLRNLERSMNKTLSAIKDL